MAQIQFSKRKDGRYVGRATVTDVCAIHIERTDHALFEIYQSHVDGGKYSITEEAAGRKFPKDIDTLFEDKIYPVYLEMVSDSEVLSAEIIYS